MTSRPIFQAIKRSCIALSLTDAPLTSLPHLHSPRPSTLLLSLVPLVPSTLPQTPPPDPMTDPSRTLLNLLHGPQPAAAPQLPPSPYGYSQQQQQQQQQLPPQFALHYGPPPPQLMPGIGPGPVPQIPMQPGFQPPQFAFPLPPQQQQQQQPQGPPQHSPNALASLLHSLNQVAPPPAPSPVQLGLGYPATRSPIEHPGTSSTPEAPQTPIIDRLSTESLKLALFGPPKPPRQDEASPPIQSPTPTNPVTSSLLSASSPDLSASASTMAAPEASAIPLQQPPPEYPLELDYNQLNSLLETSFVAARKSTPASTGSVTPTASISTSTPVAQKPMFTYMNPFHLLQKTPAPASPASPAKEQQRAEVDTQKTEQQQGQSQPQPQPQGGNNRKALRGQEQGTLDHTVSKHRGTREGNEDGHTSSLRSIPDGLRLPSIPLTYNCALANKTAVSRRNLRIVEISKVPSPYEFRLGRTIAANQEYICYAVKEGKIRVIYQPKGNKTLLRGHGKAVLDMAFGPADHALLASVDRESRLSVWRILGVAEEEKDEVELPYKQVLELRGTPTSPSADAPSSRFRRVVWHPTDAGVLAVATDREIWIVNLAGVLAGREDAVVDEIEAIEKGVIKLEGYEEPINDLAFSPDGTALATAGPNGLIHLWSISYTAPPTLLTTFTTDPTTFVAFADGPLGPSYLFAPVRYLITGHDRNRVLKLWSLRDPTSGPLHSLTFAPPPSRKNSRGAAGPSASPSPSSSRHEIPMFNLAAFDRSAGCVVVANSARASLFAIRLQVEEDSVGSTAEVIGSAPGTAAGDPSRFDYIVEVPVKQPITSLCLVSEETNEDSRGPAVLVYAVQTAAVRYYQLDADVVRPTDWEKAEVLGNQDVQVQEKAMEEERREQVTIMTSEVVSAADAAELSNHGGVGAAEAAKEAMVVEAVKESAAMEEDAKKAQDPEPEPGKDIKLSGPVVNGAIAKLKEKRRAEQGRKGAVEVTEEPAEGREPWVSVAETVSVEDAVRADQTKALREMLGGPKKEREKGGNNSERREKHRERKEGKEKEKEKESEKERDKDKEDALAAQKFDQPASSSSAASTPHRLSLADVPRLSPQPSPDERQPAAGGAKVIAPTPPSPKLAPVLDPISSSSLTLPVASGEAAGGNGQTTLGMQQVVKELRKVEDNVANKVGKVVGKEMSKQYQRLEEGLIAHQAAETSRQETILKLVSQTLSTNTQKLLEQTIRNEMQSAVIPSLGKTVTAAVEKQIGKSVVETMNKGIANAIDKSVADNVNRIMSKPAFIETVSKTVAKSLRPLVEETFKESFGNLLIPAYQSATTQMFEQISGAFDKGLQSSVTKSVGDGVADVHSALIRMQTSVDALAQQVRDLQAQVAASPPQPPVGGAINTISAPQPTTPAAIQMQMHLPPAVGTPLDWRTGSTALGGTVASGRYGSPDPYGTRSVQGPSSAGSAGSTLAYRSGSLSQLFPPTVSAHILQLNQEIDQAITKGDYDDAFWKALQSNDQAVVLRLCSKLNPAVVLSPLRSTLNQPILLSLLHNLSHDLTTYMELRFNWIQEVLVKLNPKDPEISEYCGLVLPQLQRRLQERYYQLATSEDEPNPHLLQTVQILAQAVQRLII